MKILKNLKFLLLLVAIVRGEAENPAPQPKSSKGPRRLSDCKKYAEDWRVAQCAASLKERNIISKGMYNTLLDYSKELGYVGGDKFWSVGVLYGKSTKLVAAVTKDPQFEKHLAANLDIRNLYHDEMYYDNMAPVDKPVLIFLRNQVDEIPELKPSLMANMHPMGNRNYGLRLYRYGPIETMSKTKDGCGNFGKWDYLQSAKSMVGAAIVMPANMWCPGTASESFLVVYGDYDVVEQGSTKDRFLMPLAQHATKSEHALNVENEPSVF